MLLLTTAVVVAALAGAQGGAGSPSATVKVAYLQGEQLVYVDRNGSTLRQAVAALLAGPTAAERRREVATAVPPGTLIRAVSVTGGVATVDLGEKFASGTSAASLSARVTQLVLTATSFRGVKSVRLRVKDATPLGLFPGFVTSRPITAKDASRPEVPPPGPPARRRSRSRTAACGRCSSASRTSRSFRRRPSTAWRASRRGTRCSRSRSGRDSAVTASAGPQTQAALERATRPDAAGGGRRPSLRGAARPPAHPLHRERPGRPHLARHLGRARIRDAGRQLRRLPQGGATRGRCRTRSGCRGPATSSAGSRSTSPPDVPPAPASHGCVRVPRYDAKWVYDHAPNGTPVTVLASSR